MPDRNLGTISIGIGVNLQALEAGLQRAYNDVEKWKQPPKEVYIGVRLGYKRTWSTDQVKAAGDHIKRLQQHIDEKPVVFKARFRPIGARDIYKETQATLNAVDKAGNFKIKPLTLRFTADTKTAEKVYSELQAYFEAHHLKVHIDYEGGPAPEPGKGGGKTKGGGGRKPSAGPEAGPDTGPSGSATREPRKPRGGGGAAATGPGPTPQPREGTPRYPYPCPYCASNFGVQENLDKHVAAKHPGGQPITGEPAQAKQAGGAKAKGRRAAPQAKATPPPEPTAAPAPEAEEPIKAKPARAREERFDKLHNYVGKGKSERVHLGGAPRDRFSMPDIGPERTETNKRMAILNAANYLENEMWGETAYTDKQGNRLGPKPNQRIIGHDVGAKGPVPIFADVGDETVKKRFAKGEEVFTDEAERIEKIAKAAAGRGGKLTEADIDILDDILGRRNEQGVPILGSGLRGKLMELRIRKPGYFFRALGVNKSAADASAKVLAQVAVGKTLSGEIRRLILADEEVRARRSGRQARKTEEAQAAAAGQPVVTSEAERARIEAKSVGALTRSEKIAYALAHGLTQTPGGADDPLGEKNLLHRLWYRVTPNSENRKPPQKWFRQLGGKVRPLPVFGRGLSVTPGLTKFGEPGEMFESERGLPYQLRDIPIKDITAWHETKPELVEQYVAKAQAGSPLPPVIVGPEKRLQDGHHRLAAAQRLGQKSLLGYEFAGTSEQAAQFPAPEKWLKARRLDRYYATERDPEGVDFPSFMQLGGVVGSYGRQLSKLKRAYWGKSKPWGKNLRMGIMKAGKALIPPRPEPRLPAGFTMEDVRAFGPFGGSLIENQDELAEWLWGNIGSDKSSPSNRFRKIEEILERARNTESNEARRSFPFRRKLMGRPSYSMLEDIEELAINMTDYAPYRGRGVKQMLLPLGSLTPDIRWTDKGGDDFPLGVDPDAFAARSQRKYNEGIAGAAEDYDPSSYHQALHHKINLMPGGPYDTNPLTSTRSMSVLDLKFPKNQLGGGIEKIGSRGQQLWQAPGPGWIIPHHLLGRMPRRIGGGGVGIWDLPDYELQPGEGEATMRGALKAKAEAGFGGACGICGVKFATEKGKAWHMRMGHAKENQWKAHGWVSGLNQWKLAKRKAGKWKTHGPDFRNPFGIKSWEIGPHEEYELPEYNPFLDEEEVDIEYTAKQYLQKQYAAEHPKSSITFKKKPLSLKKKGPWGSWGPTPPPPTIYGGGAPTPPAAVSAPKMRFTLHTCNGCGNQPSSNDPLKGGLCRTCRLIQAKIRRQVPQTTPATVGPVPEGFTASATGPIRDTISSMASSWFMGHPGTVPPFGYVSKEDLGLFHATMALPDILAEGIKSQEMLTAEGKMNQGLGGGFDRSHLTWSRQHAINIAKQFAIHGRAARGEMTVDEVIDEYGKLGLNKHFRSLIGSRTTAKSWPEWAKRRFVGSLADPNDAYGMATMIDSELFGATHAPTAIKSISAGILTGRSAALRMDPNRIGVVQLARRKGVKLEGNRGEWELAAKPQDLVVLGAVPYGLGGDIEGAPGRVWHFILDGKKGSVRGNDAQVAQWVRTMTAQGHTIKPATGAAPEGPGGIPSHSSHIRKRAGGGQSPKGMYVVGEAGPELFVPESMGWIIPHDVMQQLPKRAEGGAVHAAKGAIIPTQQSGFAMEGKQGRATITDLVTRGTISAASIQRVYVVNWPPSLQTTIKGGPSGGRGGGPFRTKTKAGTDTGGGPGDEFVDKGPGKGILTRRDKLFAAEIGRVVKTARAGTGGGGGGGGGRLGGIDSLSRAEFRSAELEASYETRQASVLKLAELNARAREAPTRAVPVAFGQFFSERFGGRKQYLERVRQAADAQQKVANQEDVVYKLRQSIYDKQKKLDEGKLKPAQRSKYADSIAKDTEALQKENETLDELRTKAGAAEEKIGGMGTVSKIFTSNIMGVLVGMQVFTAAQEGMAAMAQAMQPAADYLMRFSATSQRVTTALGKQLVEVNGNTEAAFGLASETARVSKATSEWAQKTLGASAIAKAAGAAQGETSDIFRAAAGQQGISGLYGGYGGIMGTGLLAQQLGGGKGFTEQIAGDLSSLSQLGQATKVLRGGNSPGLVGERMVLEGISGLQGKATVPGTFEELSLSPEQRQAREAFTAYVKDLNDAADRGAKALAGTAVHFEDVSTIAARTGKSVEELNAAFQKAGQEAGDSEYSKKINEAGLVLVDAAGNLVSSGKEYETAVMQLAKGKTLVDIGTYAKQIRQGMQVQAQAAQAQWKFQQGFGLAYEMQMQRQASGAAYMAPRAGINVFGVSGGARTQIEQSVTNITTMQTAMNKVGDAAVASSKAFVSAWASNDVSTAYNKQLGYVQNIGKRIAGIQTSIFDTQLRLNNAMYKNTIRLASRAYKDALGLAGKATGASNLGAVQREQTMLGFALQQRQITTQLAVAQFAAPGQTGEERYMRQQEAITEAKIAQKQLNLARKAFGIESTRGVTDTGIQLALTKMQWDAENLLIAKQKELAKAEEYQQLWLGRLTTSYQTAKGNFDAFMTAASEAAVKYGISLDDARKALIAAFKTPLPTGSTRPGGKGALESDQTQPSSTTIKLPAVGLDVPKNTIFSTPNAGLSQSTPIYATIVSLPKTNPYNPGGRPPGSKGGPQEQAAGFLGNVTGASPMTVGEAGTETVAVLRNPRSLGVGPGAAPTAGGGSTFNIVVNYSGTGTGDDARALAIQIAAEVERELSRKGQLLGLRGTAF